MRQRAWAAIGLVAIGFGLAMAAPQMPGEQAWNVVAGLLLVAGLVLATSLLAFWRRVFPPLPPMEGLFPAPRASERWCTRCGHPTARKGPCRTCGHTPASRGKES